MTYRGGCHCGTIAFEVDGDFTEAMSCNCSYCRPQGFLLAFVPRGALRLTTPETDMATYLFNKRQIHHHFCRTCGVAPFGEGVGPNGSKMAAVNLRCVPGVDLKGLTITEFDGASQ